MTSFIVVDGIDGCGKTTISKYIADKIGAEYMRSFGQGPIGTAIRNEFLTMVNKHNFITEILWLLSANLETIYNHVVPTLETKSVVLDRYISSTFAYQVHRSRDHKYAAIFNLVKDQVFEDNIIPDLYIWVDVDPIVSMNRTIARGGQNHYDTEPIEYRRKTIDGFAELYESIVFPNQVVINGNQELSKVLEDVDMALADFKLGV